MDKDQIQSKLSEFFDITYKQIIPKNVSYDRIVAHYEEDTDYLRLNEDGVTFHNPSIIEYQPKIKECGICGKFHNRQQILQKNLKTGTLHCNNCKQVAKKYPMIQKNDGV